MASIKRGCSAPVSFYFSSPLHLIIMSSIDHNEDLFLTNMDELVPQMPSEASAIVSLSFHGLLDPPLRLQTDQTECGGKLWPAGEVLAQFLLSQHNMGGKTMFVRPSR